MMTYSPAQLLHAAERFCEIHNRGLANFGYEVMNHGNFFKDIKEKGRRIFPETSHKFRDYFYEHGFDADAYLHLLNKKTKSDCPPEERDSPEITDSKMA